MSFKVSDIPDKELKLILVKQGIKSLLLAMVGVSILAGLDIAFSKDPAWKDPWDWFTGSPIVFLVYLIAIGLGMAGVYRQFSDIEVICLDDSIEVRGRKTKTFPVSLIRNVTIVRPFWLGNHRLDGTPLAILMIRHRFFHFRSWQTFLKIDSDENVQKLALEISKKYGLPLKTMNAWGYSKEFLKR